MSVQDEFLALLSAAQYTVHAGQIPAKPVYPFVHVSSSPPRPGERALSRDPTAVAYLWRLSPNNTTESGVLKMCTFIRKALEGARINGHRVEEIPNNVGVLDDPKYTTEARPVFFTKLEFQLMQPNI